MSRLADRVEHARFFALSQDLLCVAELDGRLRELNPSWEGLGWSLAELKRRPWLEFVHPEDAARAREAFAALSSVRPLRPLEFRWRRKDGTFARLAWRAAASAEEGCFYGCAREQSEADALEGRFKEELMQAEKLASIGLLLGGIAHELSNPLTTILGHVQLLLLENPAEGPLRQDLSLILRETGRCTRLIKSLLTFARKGAPQRLPADLNVLVKEMLELKGYDLRRNGIAVAPSLAPDLPQALVDPHQIEQVLLNLFNNAEQALDGKRGTLKVETFLDGDRVAFAVEDSGPGVAAKDVARLFEPFFTTKQVGKGTGLGLSICRRILLEHGGTLAFESRPGQGARFVARLPPLQRPPERPAARQPARILVLDDDKDVLRFMCRALRHSGREADGFSTGPGALEALAQTRYDAVVSDLFMPGMGGELFYREAVSLRPDLASRFILLTGQGNLRSARAFCEKEGVPMLVKPFELEDFERALAKAAAK